MNYNLNDVWSIIDDATKNNYVVGCDTSSTSLYNLPTSHAYTVLGNYEIKDAIGNVVVRLYHVRNPWAVDVYTGPWNDNDSKWTDLYRSQVPYIKNTNDGGFFIPEADFVRAFYYFQVAYVTDSWKHSFYEVENDTAGALRTFTFTTTQSNGLYITADFYDSRMYPQGCKSSFTSGALSLW